MPRYIVRGEMKLKKDEEELHSKEVEVGEDTTKYGEFISSYFAWVTLPEQKSKAQKLENVTKTPNESKKDNKVNEEK